MRLLVIIIRDRSKLTPVLDSLYELGVKGATVVKSQDMGNLIADHAPFIARFAELVNNTAKGSKTIFSVIKEKETLEKAIDAIEKILGDLENSNV